MVKIKIKGHSKLVATCIDIATLNEPREIEHHPITKALCVCQTNLALVIYFSLWEKNILYTTDISGEIISQYMYDYTSLPD